MLTAQGIQSSRIFFILYLTFILFFFKANYLCRYLNCWL